MVFVLEAIFEEDFLGFSYGFRPGRGPHDALDALHAGIYRKRVNWVLDALLTHRAPPSGSGVEAVTGHRM